LNRILKASVTREGEKFKSDCRTKKKKMYRQHDDRLTQKNRTRCFLCGPYRDYKTRTDWRTRKTTILDGKYEIPGLDRLLKHKRKLRKLWHKTRDPACKMAVNWVTKDIRRMVRRRALEIRGNKVAKLRSHTSSNMAY
jgi:hypothetical protein